MLLAFSHVTEYFPSSLVCWVGRQTRLSWREDTGDEDKNYEQQTTINSVDICCLLAELMEDNKNEEDYYQINGVLTVN